MKLVRATLALAIISGAVVTTAAQTSPASAAKPGAPIVTIGCINRGQHSGSQASTPGAPPATPETAPILANSTEPTNTFILTGARPPKAEDAAAAAADKTKPAMTTYRLEGDMREFEKHNGHRVEVTGTLNTTTAPEKAETKSNIAVLRVQSMKMIASECPAGPDSAKPE
jgi:hypothetical protein